MPKTISILNLFPTYATREDYEARTGKPCPAWNPNRQPKVWEDPNARKVFVVGSVPHMLYDRVFLDFDANGLPIWDQLGLPVEEAKTVNIPPRGPGDTNIPGADKPEVKVPMRAPTDSEIVKGGFGNIPQVWSSAELVTVDTGFTQADRALLVKIAAKLGA